MRQSLPAHFIDRLRDLVGEAFAVDDDDVLQRFSADETPNLTPSRPDVVVRPGTVDDVQRVMQLCAANNVFVTPRGAGSGKSGGCVPVFGGVVMALDRLNTITTIDKDDQIARVQPGVILQPFQEAVEAEGMFYPPDPASLSWCTLGGNVACNAGGPRALKYGVTGGYVLGVEVVLPTGEKIRTGKNTTKGVAGYDVTSLMVGSEGTLGIITGITLKLLPNPRFVQTALAIFPDTGPAVRAVSAILARGILPRTLEYMDRDSIEAVKVMSPPYRFPAGAGAALILETDGDSEQGTLDALAICLDVCSEHGAVDGDRLGTQRLCLEARAQAFGEIVETSFDHRLAFGGRLEVADGAGFEAAAAGSDDDSDAAEQTQHRKRRRKRSRVVHHLFSVVSARWTPAASMAMALLKLTVAPVSTVRRATLPLLTGSNRVSATTTVKLDFGPPFSAARPASTRSWPSPSTALA